MTGHRSKRSVIFLIAAFLLIAALVPPLINANRFRNRLADTIRRSLGRPVQMGDIHFRLLPRPGFVIDDLSVTDDPAFSSEPVLRARSVAASLRLTSLWRGRLEISRLSFESPSLNLVRSLDGRWNVEPILQNASRVPAAPTARTKPEERPRFPYIEATDGRINFRLGQEKRPHVLMDANFSLWLESEEQWNTRLEARPTRTDMNLSDTGLVRAEGWLRKGDSLAATAIKLKVTAEKAQLGQWTSLLTGSDHGWRGDTRFSTELQGKISDFTYDAQLFVRDFHRHDISTRDSFDLHVACRGRVNSPDASASLRETFDCNAPFASGSVVTTGVVDLRRDPDYEVRFKLAQLSADTLADLYRHVKKDVPQDLDADGAVTGEFSVKHSQGVTLLTGSARATDFGLSSDSLKTSLRFPNFDLNASLPSKNVSSGSDKTVPPPAEWSLVIGPAGLRLGGSIPVYLNARVAGDGVTLQVKGEAEIAELLSAAALLGLADPRYKLSGVTSLDLAVYGRFAGFSPPVITGAAGIRNVRAQVDGVVAPLSIQSALLNITPASIVVQRLSARLEGTSTLAEGNLTIPRGCTSECVSTFDLKASRVNLDEVNRVLNPRYRSSGWLAPLRFFEGKPVKESRLNTVRAEGRIAVDSLLMKELFADRVTARLSFDRGRLTLSDLRGNLLGGAHTGRWVADLNGPEPTYSGDGMVEKLNIAQLSALLHSPAGAGAARVKYQLKLQGNDATSLRDSASGSAEFRWTTGSWRTSGSSSLQFSDWTGRLSIANGAAEIAPSRITLRSGPYQASGRVGFDRTVNLKLEGRDTMLLSGSLADLRVATQSAERLPVPDSASNPKHVPSPKKRP